MTVNKINKKIKSLVFLEEINEFKNWTRTPSTNPDRAHKAVNQTRFSRHGRIFIYCCVSGLLNAPIVLTRKKNKSQFLFFQTITAEDNGGKSNSATVNIKVEDVNDQSPEFVRVHHMFSRILNYFFQEKNTFLRNNKKQLLMIAFYNLLILIVMSVHVILDVLKMLSNLEPLVSFKSSAEQRSDLKEYKSLLLRFEDLSILS